ncbi:cold-shock protein [Hymenobacter latericus]|uniref:cold-shock protein n=1 Tax=Hymenobacter sp. YIM 151858-1 TaxID=2987688 RepID=UPI002226E113|nr:cold shock domain-containing protein [Hymenobacter sp. YIM 151858-1]UYZ57960.1 cold shock domain-containing protein [Hymenobacter sp. YIM 151858-1]
MSRGQGSFGKRENEKKRASKQKQKEERKQERQAGAKKGQSLEDMMAYVDEFGNITNTPPDPNRKREEIDVNSIRLGAAPVEEENPEDKLRTGVVSFFNESKGFGFIKDKKTQESIFVHASGLVNPIKEGDAVTFEIENGHKGPQAVSVRTGGAQPA